MENGGIYFPLVDSKESSDPSNIVQFIIWQEQSRYRSWKRPRTQQQCNSRWKKCEPKKKKETNEQCFWTMNFSKTVYWQERLLKFRAEETESQESTSWKWWNWCLTNCILLLLELRSRVQWASFCMKLICILPYNIATFTKRKYHWVNYLHFTICWLNSSTFGNHWAEAMNNIMWNIIIGWDQKFTNAIGFKPIAMRQKILAYVNFILTPKQGLFIQTAGVMICQTELSQSKKFSQY